VLIEGEAGTGKSLAAQAIHQNSPRRDEPFVWIDCGALDEPLFERELFGRDPGASSEGDRAQRGRLELADGGTLLLDEIDELPPGAQVRLLRVLACGTRRGPAAEAAGLYLDLDAGALPEASGPPGETVPPRPDGPEHAS
jgi:DNA-binding NtrC family response regulator